MASDLTLKFRKLAADAKRLSLEHTSLGQYELAKLANRENIVWNRAAVMAQNDANKRHATLLDDLAERQRRDRP